MDISEVLPLNAGLRLAQCGLAKSHKLFRRPGGLTPHVKQILAIECILSFPTWGSGLDHMSRRDVWHSS